MNATSSWQARCGEFLGLALLLLIWGWLYLIEPLQGVLGDFRVYYLAAGRFAAGLSIYDFTYEITAADGRLFRLFYFYPPFLAQWMQPLTRLDFEVAKQIWVATTAVALLVASAALAEVLRDVWPKALRRSTAFLLSGLFVLCFEPTYWGVKEGQVNAVLFALLGLAVLALLRRFDRLGGFLIGIAALIKMSPALLLLVPLVRRQWGAFIGCGIAGVLALVFLLLEAPLAVYRDFLTPFGPLLGGTLERHYIFNFAADKALLQLVGLDGVVPLRWIVRAFLLGAAAVGVWRLRDASDTYRAFAAYAFLLPCMVLAAPTLWGHHLIWVLPAILCLMVRHRPIEQEQYRQWFFGLGLYVLLGQVLLIQLRTCRAVLPEKCVVTANMSLTEIVVPAPELLLSLSTLLPTVLLCVLAVLVLRSVR